MKFKAFLAQFLALNLLLPMSAVSIHAENNATNTNTTLNETQKDDICTKGPNYEAKKKLLKMQNLNSQMPTQLSQMLRRLTMHLLPN